MLKLLESKTGVIMMSILWGLGLACLFRKVCKDRDCIVYHAPNMEEIKKILQNTGQTEINLIINEKNKKVHYNLKNTRKFDLNQLKTMKSKEYVRKITV